MPGETVSCIGCHEDQNQIPIPKRTIASQTKPHRLQAPEGGVRSFTFDLEIQPILDRACVACHNEKSHMNLTELSAFRTSLEQELLGHHALCIPSGSRG